MASSDFFGVHFPLDLSGSHIIPIEQAATAAHQPGAKAGTSDEGDTDPKDASFAVDACCDSGNASSSKDGRVDDL
ncbi:hypothetical protein BCR41DRAFT_396522 [Lobosporangium transversale]|uniref:Uncharacterized protein n=1 Tax=Lobosporangium transversale TaxID=64571 RepID=A0A1Y2GMI5_9FUNG|nr:hypothetical protein BCR41DRAFT_396508 [Lobosporangium transversale]XP_021881307.1 hypothetical protein BCR41DRAFT_396522 [Lobosporangium transversale]ORZ15544.1 hypothetical protein BCR41DRAFT_396508 [Lobosporangium transversale]ORZ15559.1 hypothetical protein BCR41DRAFT_396522 [Lobosporangium transversale]|eukprot:XP_021881292.1 hypothetical protein BCR41DRAFT_396508 [Lobosporangium transversale]